ncbi:MAG: S1 RNA-binding domain-containing protein, partial [Acidobacteria bacterium]|nr:S1 RNA-binding domain-containing protein [Acidobacteriota bacterium]
MSSTEENQQPVEAAAEAAPVPPAVEEEAAEVAAAGSEEAPAEALAEAPATGSDDVEVVAVEDAEAEDRGAGELSFEDFARMIDESMHNLVEGEIVEGRVIEVNNDSVVIDVGYKSEGVVSASEFKDRDGVVTVAVGDVVEVLLEKTEDVEGHVLLSRQKAERLRRWNDVERSYKDGAIIKGRVVDRIKGGLTVDVGLRAFLPGSLVDIKPVKHLESLKGQELEFKVISLDRRRNNIVLSRKAVLEKEFAKKKKETL